MPEDDKPGTQPGEEVLNISWEDLEDLPPVPPAAPPLDLSAGEFPPVEAGAPVTDSRQPWIEIAGICGRDQRPFEVTFAQTAPGVYTFTRAVPLPPSPSGKFSGVGEGDKGKPGGPQGQAQGRFDLKGYTGCPCCGQLGLVQCDRCGTVMCGSAVREDRQGLYCQCPNCGGRGRLAPGTAVTVQGEVGGVKGDKFGKR